MPHKKFRRKIALLLTGRNAKALLWIAALSGFLPTSASPRQPPVAASHSCKRAVLEGEANAGQAFDRVFAPGLRFYLEPLPSGWIIRVLDANAPREAHDYAELATPPYQSVSPLLISTDWAFRAQDAVAWNPRHFHFAENRAAFQSLKRLLPGALSGDGASAVKIAALVSVQPEGKLEVLDARFAPGVADQSRMAATVATHLATTPHSADSSRGPSALGKLEDSLPGAPEPSTQGSRKLRNTGRADSVLVATNRASCTGITTITRVRSLKLLRCRTSQVKTVYSRYEHRFQPDEHQWPPDGCPAKR